MQHRYYVLAASVIVIAVAAISLISQGNGSATRPLEAASSADTASAGFDHDASRQEVENPVVAPLPDPPAAVETGPARVFGYLAHSDTTHAAVFLDEDYEPGSNRVLNTQKVPSSESGFFEFGEVERGWAFLRANWQDYGEPVYLIHMPILIPEEGDLDLGLLAPRKGAAMRYRFDILLDGQNALPEAVFEEVDIPRPIALKGAVVNVDPTKSAADSPSASFFLYPGQEGHIFGLEPDLHRMRVFIPSYLSLREGLEGRVLDIPEFNISSGEVVQVIYEVASVIRHEMTVEFPIPPGAKDKKFEGFAISLDAPETFQPVALQETEHGTLRLRSALTEGRHRLLVTPDGLNGNAENLCADMVVEVQESRSLPGELIPGSIVRGVSYEDGQVSDWPLKFGARDLPRLLTPFSAEPGIDGKFLVAGIPPGMILTLQGSEDEFRVEEGINEGAVFTR